MPTTQLFKSIDSIELKNVSKKYNNLYAVDTLDLTIKGGELLILIGGSGSGKTTTLKMINRLIEPDNGDIYINGTNTKQYDPVTLRRNIGYVIQQIGLFQIRKYDQEVQSGRTTHAYKYHSRIVPFPFHLHSEVSGPGSYQN